MTTNPSHVHDPAVQRPLWKPNLSFCMFISMTTGCASLLQLSFTLQCLLDMSKKMLSQYEQHVLVALIEQTNSWQEVDSNVCYINKLQLCVSGVWSSHQMTVLVAERVELSKIANQATKKCLASKNVSFKNKRHPVLQKPTCFMSTQNGHSATFCSEIYMDVHRLPHTTKTNTQHNHFSWWIYLRYFDFPPL